MSTIATLEKRTTESLTYDFDCSDLLGASETITSVTSVTADQAGLVFGIPLVNAAQITYPDGRVAATGKVIQVLISAGVIAPGSSSMLYTIRALFQTSQSPNVREATVLLNVTNQVA